MTELEKCIKLAEAMGWRRSKWFFQDCYWTTDDDPILRLVNTGYFFDPFTDPTDDYKVLEWMRDNYETQEIEIAFEHQGFGHRWVYDVGCYARAALDLLTGEITKCSDCSAALQGESDG